MLAKTSGILVRNDSIKIQEYKDFKRNTPVSVAILMIPDGLNVWAYVNASHKMSRPSASVLFICSIQHSTTASIDNVPYYQRSKDKYTTLVQIYSLIMVGYNQMNKIDSISAYDFFSSYLT